MNYTVDWLKEALDQLAAVWVAASDRDAVSSASHELEQVIGRRPLGFGEARASSVVRVAYHPPLGIEFEIIEDDKRVRVLRVWAVR